MKEFIDSDGIKMMALIMGKISYDGREYLLYSIKRNNNEANIFISKLVKTSSGYTISHSFDNGEKEILYKFIQRIINKEDISLINKDGYSIVREVALDEVNSFDVEACYVASVSKEKIKDIVKYYDLVNEGMFNSPVVDVVEEKRFSGGFITNVFAIVFSVVVFIVCSIMLFQIFFK